MKVVQTNEAPQAIGPYSQAIDAGEFVFTSGQIPLTAAGEFLGGTIEEQTHLVFDNLKAVLEAAGTSLDRVVKATVYLDDMNEFVQMNGVYEERFGSHKPARSAFEVARLPKDVKVEIEVIAKK